MPDDSVLYEKRSSKMQRKFPTTPDCQNFQPAFFRSLARGRVLQTCAVCAFSCAYFRRFVPPTAKKARGNQSKTTLPQHKQAIESSRRCDFPV
jgi:hypothetical protein